MIYIFWVALICAIVSIFIGIASKKPWVIFLNCVALTLMASAIVEHGWPK